MNYTLTAIVKVEEKNKATNTDDTSGASTLFIPVVSVLKGTYKVMKILDGIGEYSTTVSKDAKFLSGVVSNRLSKWGYPNAANRVKTLGDNVSKFATEKVAPIEKKVANKIAPFVKSKAFQTTKNALGVVNAVLSVKGALTKLGVLRKVKLSSTISAIKRASKTNLTEARKIIGTRIMRKAEVAKGLFRPNNLKRVKQRVTKNFFKNPNESTKSAWGVVKGVKSGVESGKKLIGIEDKKKKSTKGAMKNRNGVTSVPTRPQIVRKSNAKPTLQPTKVSKTQPGKSKPTSKKTTKKTSKPVAKKSSKKKSEGK